MSAVDFDQFSADDELVVTWSCGDDSCDAVHILECVFVAADLVAKPYSPGRIRTCGSENILVAAFVSGDQEIFIPQEFITSITFQSC